MTQVTYGSQPSAPKEPGGVDGTIAHYTTGDVRDRIDAAIVAAGLDPATITTADLAMLEDFHSLGRLATLALVDLAHIGPTDRVLDAGSGIGGTARLLAGDHGCRVTAVDLTPEYCEIAKWLNDVVGLSDLIEVSVADVTQLPFETGSFDVVVSQHVQMNIADKRQLYAEAHRVLAPDGRLALWDVTAGTGGPLHFPVPWADSAEHSHLVSPEELVELLEDTGFSIAHWNDLTESAGGVMTDFFAGEQPPLGLHVFVPQFESKVTNLIANLDEGRARLIQAVVVAGSGGTKVSPKS